MSHTEEEIYNTLINGLKPGNIYFITGKNGSGKSRFFHIQQNTF
ncbi:hypothetical protein [Erwinia mallotivora]|nr:hypothetical protein [Erwinia mallotivora]